MGVMKRIHAKRSRGESVGGSASLADPVIGSWRDVMPPGGLPTPSEPAKTDADLGPPIPPAGAADRDRLPPPYAFGDDPEWGGVARRWAKTDLFGLFGGE